jgi:hypothetical protein
MKYWPVYLLICLVIVSCDREESPDCFQTGGETASEYRSLEAFNRLELRDYIHYELLQSAYYAIEISGPGNLLNDITTEVKDGKLTVSNDNTCNFVRSFKRTITVRIFAPHFGEIDHFASGDVSSVDTLIQSRFLLNFRNATGRVNLQLHCDTVSLFMHTGAADCIASGISKTTELFANGLGFMDASGLQTENAFIRQTSIQTLKAQASGYMYCLILSRGDVYMYDNPQHRDIEDRGDGELIFIH